MMTVPQTDRQGRGAWRCNKWAGAAALLIGSVAVVVALIVAAGMQLASSPSAVAGTTVATPWVIPPFAPPPTRQPQSAVSAQGTNSGSGGGSTSGGAEWSAKATPAYNDVAAGIQGVGNSLSAQDIDGAKAACARLHDAGVRLGATLPSPLPALTSELNAIVGDVGTATNACASLGPGSGQAGMDAVTGPLNQAADHFANARRIAQNGG